MFIELTNSYKRAPTSKFSLNKDKIIYFSSYQFSVQNDNYEDCKSIVEVIGGEEGYQLYHVKETYEQLKEMLSA